ncbi:MAG: class II aldolase/adducin family protein [Acidobacteriota bacterium]
MSHSTDQHRKDIVEIGRRVYRLGYVAAYDGNISVRLDDGNILVTPSAISKGYMTENDLVIVDPDGKKISGERKASSESAMHLLIYKLRPDVRAVVHAHPPCATGYAAAGIPLNKALVSEIVMVLGCVPLAPYGTTGTPELTEAIRPLIPNHDAVLLANHGVVTYGADVFQAHGKMETVEHFARISLVARILGKEVLLSPEDVGKLMLAREKYGLKTPLPIGEACPRVSGDDEPTFIVTRSQLVDLVQSALDELQTAKP